MAEFGRVFVEPRTDVASVTQKLTIGSYDLYITVGWGVESSTITYLDIKLSQGVDDNMRAALEVALWHVEDLVEAGWTVEKAIARWRGSHLEPSGFCPQLGGHLVSSPLDAVARYLEEKTAEARQMRLELGGGR